MPTPEFDLDWLVSVDDHVLEPPNVWQDRVPAKYRDQAPRLVMDDDGEHWHYDGARSATIGLTISAGRDRERFTPLPLSYADAREGCYNSVARVGDMDRSGVLASMCFPSFPRFCGQVFLEAPDKDLALLCVRAYNDWMIDEWCGSAPGRFIPLVLMPLWDAKLAAAEVERCAGKGAHALAFSENPVDLGLRTVHDADGYWDPVWSVCNDADVVVCMHIGSSSQVSVMAPDSPPLAQLAWSPPAKISGTMIDWLLSPAFQKYPNLKIALSEGNIGWMPYFLEHLELVIGKQRYWASQKQWDIDVETLTMKLIPSTGVDLLEFDAKQVFRDHVYGCFIEDRHGALSIEEIGVDNVMVETDYPHSDSTWPDCIKSARAEIGHLSEADQYKVLRGNAERVFSFTPAPAPAPSLP